MIQIIIILLAVGSVGLAISIYVLLRHYERTVCTEICNIYCNSIVALDQCVGLASDILKEWQKFSVKISFDDKIETEDVERVLQMFELKFKNVLELYEITPKLTFESSLLKQIVLSQHKLPLQEVQLAIKLPKTIYDELKALINDVKDELKNGNVDILRLNFIQIKFMAFKEETIGMYYGAMEGICSFPSSVLRIYEEVAFRLKCLPVEVGCNKRKEDYLHFQEMQMNKAQNLLVELNEYLDNTDNLTKTFAVELLKKDIYLFFSGSKSLELERNIFNGAVVRQQTKWKDKGLRVYGVSYQNFPHEVVKEGHQSKYDIFIQEHTDAIFFVLNGSVGGYTEKEFRLAMQSFSQKGTPKIYVYSKMNDVANPSVEKLRTIISDENQYWQDYTDDTNLKLLMENDMTDAIASVYEENIKVRRNILE